MTTWGKGPRGKATMLHSYVVRSRGACEMCGRPGEDLVVAVPKLGKLVLPIGGLQAAHIVSRSYAATRTDETNAWALCPAHHRRLTQHPEEHVWFATRTLGEAGYAELRAKAYQGLNAKPAFWQAEIDRLTALLAEVSS